MLSLLRRRTLAIACILFLTTSMTHANGGSRVVINGQALTQQQVRVLESQIGSKIAPGVYLVDAQGCWYNMSTAQGGCLGSSGVYNSRYGSGERASDGSWNHYSRAAGAGVGGTSDGCIYTTLGWSNC